MIRVTATYKDATEPMVAYFLKMELVNEFVSMLEHFEWTDIVVTNV